LLVVDQVMLVVRPAADDLDDRDHAVILALAEVDPYDEVT